jgi:ubiquitin C-terminal hydrolase
MSRIVFSHILYFKLVFFYNCCVFFFFLFAPVVQPFFFSFEITRRLDKHKVNYSGIVEKDELIRLLMELISKQDESPLKRYDLLANIVHEGPAQAGSYRAHIHHRASNTWYEVQDLNVTTSETMAELVAISEAYIQIYELKQ